MGSKVAFGNTSFGAILGIISASLTMAGGKYFLSRTGLHYWRKMNKQASYFILGLRSSASKEWDLRSTFGVSQ